MRVTQEELLDYLSREDCPKKNLFTEDEAIFLYNMVDICKTLLSEGEGEMLKDAPEMAAKAVKLTTERTGITMEGDPYDIFQHRVKDMIQTIIEI